MLTRNSSARSSHFSSDIDAVWFSKELQKRKTTTEWINDFPKQVSLMEQIKELQAKTNAAILMSSISIVLFIFLISSIAFMLYLINRNNKNNCNYSDQSQNASRKK